MIRRAIDHRGQRSGRKRSACGFTLVEVAISGVIISIMLVAALETVAASRDVQVKAERRAMARMLADDLMGQIFRLSYSDQTAAIVLFGPEAGELLAGKGSFDDVDDFNGWSESPPQNATGAAMTGYTGWSRTVTVEWVSATSPSTVSLVESGAKRITVIVKYNNNEVARRVAIRTQSATPTS